MVRARPKVAGQRSRARSAPTVVQPAVAQPAPTRPRGPALPGLARTWAGLSLKRSPEAVTSGSTRRRRWVAPLVALVAALAVLGAVVGVSLRDADATSRAERAATNQARASIEQMLSYNYKTIDAQAAQIEGLLTGSFKDEFSQAMDKDIKPLAVKNQTVVQARVSDLGVMRSGPRTVTVLAFVNQAKIGADEKQPAVDQNRVIATMSKVGDRWLVSRVQAF
jgi:Mce-associated membrane protein